MNSAARDDREHDRDDNDQENVVDASDRFGGQHPLARSGQIVPPAAGGELTGYAPHQWGPRDQRAVFVPGERTDRPEHGGSEEAGLVPREVRRMPVRRPRNAAPVDGAALVRRAERRARQARQARTVGGWLAERGWWTLRGLAYVGTVGIYRLVWQPARAERVDTLEETNPLGAEKAAERLSNSRKIRSGVVVATGLVGYQFGPELVHLIPWWADVLLLGGAVPALAATGRPEGEAGTDPEQQAEIMPDGLALDASDRGVAQTLTEALEDAKLRGKVHDVQRAAAGWGWTVTLALLDRVTEAKLEDLERFINTPVGGLVLSPESQAARVRYLRIVMADLLAESAMAPVRPPDSLDPRQPVELATRFDGGRLALELFARHILLIGRTRSGKSGALHDIVDALLASGTVVRGLDLAAGPDLRAWEDALESYVGGQDFVAAERLLQEAVDLIRDRTARLGARDWDPQVDGPGLAVVIDEYGQVAQVPRLRVLAEYIVTYGAKAGVWLVAANQRKVKELMGSSLIASQVHIKVYLGMSEEDAEALPKSLRAQGVRPHLFRQATQTDPGDAGKSFVLGVEPLPILVRFDRMAREEAVRRAAERAKSRPELGERDQEVIRRAETDGVPAMLLAARDAVLEASSAAGRVPARASCEEIATYLGERGHPVGKDALTRTLREQSGGLVTRSRDTNLAPRVNPKGFYLDDLESAIAALREQARQATEADAAR